MVSKVVSTKLSTDEHGKLLEICRMQNSTPSALIKNLILNLITNIEKNPTSAVGKESRSSQFVLDEQTITGLLNKIDVGTVKTADLNTLYLKLGEKFEKSGLSKSEALLYRKIYQKLKEKAQYNPVIQSLPQNTPQEQQIKDENMSMEERFQYF